MVLNFYNSSALKSHLMLNRIEKQLLDLGYNPVFFRQDSKELLKYLQPDELISGFFDGFIDTFDAEGTVFSTNKRLVFLSRGRTPHLEEIGWKSIVRLETDINESISEFGFITPFRSIFITAEDSRYPARVFYKVMKNELETKNNSKVFSRKKFSASEV